MFRPLFIIIILCIIASFILQMITLLSNFNGLHSVYLAKVSFSQKSGRTGLVANLWNVAQSALLGSTIVPSYFTLGIFVICQGDSAGQTVMCSPASFGYNYNATGVLQTIEDNIPEDAHSLLAKTQQGVFIPSVLVCFLLMWYSLLFLSCGDSLCNYIMIVTVSVVALLFCVATFAVQFIAFDQLTAQISQAKTTLFGGLLNDLITVETTRGMSIWLSLAAFILLFLATLMFILDGCLQRKKKDQRQPNVHEMRPIQY